MSNVKISALPLSTGTTFNDWVIKNNSGETITEKAQLKDVLGMTSLNGNNAIQSSSWLTQLGTTASTESAIAIGNGAEATSPYAIAIGYKALNVNRDGNRDKYIAIGYEAQSITDGVAMGSDARCLSNGGFAIGNGTRVFGNGGFALGNGAESYGIDGIAIGSNSRDNTGLSGFNNGIAIGSGATVGGDKSIAIGYGSNALSVANNSIAIGGQTIIGSFTQYGITIGHDSSVSVTGGIAIGGEAVSDQQNAIALGYQINTDFPNTTKTRSVQSTGQFFNRVQNLGSGTTFNVDWNLGGSVEFTLTGNGTCTLSNVRDGGIYRVKVTTTGNYIFTPSASGYTFINQGGGLNLTNNGTDLCILHVFGTVVMVTHFADFS
jgi:hypothetical protein